MPKFTVPALVVLACLPLLFVVWLFTAARTPAMDGLVMVMPAAVRTSVAGLAINGIEDDKKERAKVDRVIRLDPENAAAWTWRCSTQPDDDAKIALADCEHAIKLKYGEDNFTGKAEAQEKLGDFCAAEDSYTMANHFVNASDGDVLRGMGRTALRCGHTAASVASFEVAAETDGKQQDDEDDADDLKLDYEWLVIANTANRNPNGAAEACGKAHKDFKACDCSFEGDKVTCRESE